MSIPRKKLDPILFQQLRQILSQMNISKQRVTIDFENDTIEVKEKHSYQHILDSIGVLSYEEAKQLEEEVKRMREEDWD